MVKRIILGIMLAAGILYMVKSSADAKPMLSPSLQEGIKSSYVIVAEYMGYSKVGKISYFNGPIARYKVLEILKGKGFRENINIKYDFQDGSACIEPEDWKFSNGLMPSKGSKWILLIDYKNSDTYSTYRGDYGRLEYDTSNENIVRDSIAKLTQNEKDEKIREYISVKDDSLIKKNKLKIFINKLKNTFKN